MLKILSSTEKLGWFNHCYQVGCLPSTSLLKTDSELVQSTLLKTKSELQDSLQPKLSKTVFVLLNAPSIENTVSPVQSYLIDFRNWIAESTEKVAAQFSFLLRALSFLKSFQCHWHQQDSFSAEFRFSYLYDIDCNLIRNCLQVIFIWVIFSGRL